MSAADFRLRVVKPRASDWISVSGESPEDAASTWFDDRFREWGVRYVKEHGGRREDVFFVRVEVEGHGEMIVREFTSGIYRRGGIKPRRDCLEDVARKIDWKGAPAELLAEPWDGEEPYR